MRGDDEVRAAAERIRDMRKASADRDGGYPATDDGRRQAILDHAMLAEAWLREHPADDGEAVTEEWLKANGFQSDEYEYPCWTLANRNLPVLVWTGKRNRLALNTHTVCYEPTRGAVRRLCQPLGVPIPGGTGD